MTMPFFISDALDRLPSPAAIFEAPSRRYLHANDAAITYVRAGLTAQEFADNIHDTHDLETGIDHILERLELDTHLEKAMASPRRKWVDVDRGGRTVVVSELEGSRYAPRPPLLLMTMHHHSLDEGSAERDHHRIEITLLINEAVERSTRAIDQAMLTLHDAAQGQRAMLDRVNTYTNDLLGEAGHKVFAKRLTSISDLPES